MPDSLFTGDTTHEIASLKQQLFKMRNDRDHWRRQAENASAEVVIRVRQLVALRKAGDDLAAAVKDMDSNCSIEHEPIATADGKELMMFPYMRAVRVAYKTYLDNRNT